MILARTHRMARVINTKPLKQCGEMFPPADGADKFNSNTHLCSLRDFFLLNTIAHFFFYEKQLQHEAVTVCFCFYVDGFIQLCTKQISQYKNTISFPTATSHIATKRLWPRFHKLCWQARCKISYFSV